MSDRSDTDWLARLSDGLAIVAGWSIFGLSLLILVDVLLRKLFRVSMQGTDEIGGYVLAVSAAVGFSYALVHKAHIRIDLLLERLPLRIRAFLHLIALLAINFYAWLLFWRGAEVVISSVELSARASTTLGTPLALPQSVWAVALLLFALIAAGMLLRCCILLLRGRWEQADALFGTKQAATEVEEEMQAARERLGRHTVARLLE